MCVLPPSRARSLRLSQGIPDVSASRNRLLAVLPRESLERLRPLLEPAELVFRATLHGPSDRIARVYFPESGWVSMLAPLENGDVAEVGLVGKEGMVGLPLLFGVAQDTLEAMVQGQGRAVTLTAKAFGEAIGADAVLRGLLLRYAAAHLVQVSRTAACNGHHLIEQRLARWLLMSHDRAETDEFPMTHEFLSMMLGVRRAGVSVAAGALQRAGLIRYERGCIAVTDRAGLESACCECYGIVRQQFDQLEAAGSRGRKPPPG